MELCEILSGTAPFLHSNNAFDITTSPYLEPWSLNGCLQLPSLHAKRPYYASSQSCPPDGQNPQTRRGNFDPTSICQTHGSPATTPSVGCSVPPPRRCHHARGSDKAPGRRVSGCPPLSVQVRCKLFRYPATCILRTLERQRVSLKLRDSVTESQSAARRRSLPGRRLRSWEMWCLGVWRIGPRESGTEVTKMAGCWLRTLPGGQMAIGMLLVWSGIALSG